MFNGIEMGLVAKKPGQVGGDRVQKGLELLLVIRDQGKIVLQTFELLLTKTFLETAFENGTIGRREGYPARVVDELPVQLKIGVAQEVGHSLVSIFPRFLSGIA